MFQWRGDTFSELPDEAVLLAESEECWNQAFMYRGRVFGFQVHLECTKATIEALLKNCSEEMISTPYVQSAREIMERIDCVKRDNEWMSDFLRRLEEETRGGSS